MENVDLNNEAQLKVSIIVPAYNLEDYIEPCLDSLVNQTLKEIEIIVINDGSTDSTQEKIEKFAQQDSRIIPLVLENGGVSNARNQGLNIAKGEYIGFVDGDDWVDNDFFEKLYHSAKNNAADISVANILKHKKQQTRFNLQYKKEKIANTIDEKIKICKDRKSRFFYIWHRLYKASLLKDINFDIGIYYEDVMFSAKTIYSANKIISVPNAKYHYICRSTSIVKSKTNQEKKISDAIMVREQLQRFAKEKGFNLPEDANYSKKNWIMKPLIKTHKGLYKSKISLFNLIPIWISKKN